MEMCGKTEESPASGLYNFVYWNRYFKFINVHVLPVLYPFWFSWFMILYNWVKLEKYIYVASTGILWNKPILFSFFKFWSGKKYILHLYLPVPIFWLHLI
jgi:hypothetical protein